MSIPNPRRRRFTLALVPTSGTAPSASLPLDEFADSALDHSVDFTLVFAEAVSNAAVVVQVPMSTLLDAEQSCSAISIDLDLEAVLGIESKAFFSDGRDVVLKATVPVHKEFPIEGAVIVWPPPASTIELGIPVLRDSAPLPAVADSSASASKVDFAFGLSALSFAERVRRAHNRHVESTAADAAAALDADANQNAVEMSVIDAGAMARMVNAHDLFALECNFLSQPEVVITHLAARTDLPVLPFVCVAKPPAVQVPGASEPVDPVVPVLRPVRIGHCPNFD